MRQHRRNLQQAAGFTLFELMVSITILATLSVLTSQTIQQAIKNKLKIEDQVDDMSQVRDALKIMQKDINLAFHYRDLEAEMKTLVKKAVPAPKPTAPVDGIASPPEIPLFPSEPNRQDPETQFVGTDKELSFVTGNTSRLYANTGQADFMKVGYALEDCRLPGEKDTTTSNCLVRKTSYTVEGDPEKFTDKIVLLSFVSELKFRYRGADKGAGKDDWVNRWSSKDNDGATKGAYPDAVEITLTRERSVAGKKRKTSMQLVAVVRFSNNKPAQDGVR